MKILKINEDWRFDARLRASKYIELLDDTNKVIKQEVDKRVKNKDWDYAGEFYDLTKRTIENLESFNEPEFNRLMAKLEKINSNDK